MGKPKLQIGGTQVRDWGYMDWVSGKPKLQIGGTQFRDWGYMDWVLGKPKLQIGGTGNPGQGWGNTDFGDWGNTEKHIYEVVYWGNPG